MKKERQHNALLCKVKKKLNTPCATPFEHSGHPFFDCHKYTDYKKILFNSLYWLPSNINFVVNLLTKGSDFLVYQENTAVLKPVFKYIKDSKNVQLSKLIQKNQHTSSNVFLFLSCIVSIYVFVYNHSEFIYLYAYYIISCAHANTYGRLLYSGEDFKSLEN